jgi:hypothetical protein
MIQKEILDEKDNMLKMAEKVKKEEKEEIEIPKVVKKPQRSRKRK